jgi:large subunit ribosomal protein L10
MPANYKVEKVAKLREMIGKTEAVFISEYRGLTVAQMTEVRAKVREAGGEMKVAKNTLMRLALQEEGLPVPEELTLGPNVYTLAYDDPVAVAKALQEFSKVKTNKAFQTKGGILGNSILNPDQVQALADLPSREQLMAQVVGTIAAPLRGLVTVLSGPQRGLVTCLSQLKDKKAEEAA